MDSMADPDDKSADSKAKDGAGGKDEEKKLSHTARRAQERREAKLEAVREAVADGSLTIRKMTAEERKKYPPKPRPERKKR
jgi:hypothetical protein